jgi:hypothetical protein
MKLINSNNKQALTRHVNLRLEEKPCIRPASMSPLVVCKESLMLLREDKNASVEQTLFFR